MIFYRVYNRRYFWDITCEILFFFAIHRTMFISTKMYERPSETKKPEFPSYLNIKMISDKISGGDLQERETKMELFFF